MHLDKEMIVFKLTKNWCEGQLSSMKHDTDIPRMRMKHDTDIPRATSTGKFNFVHAVKTLYCVFNFEF